jgi:hypothetical protein
MLCCGVGDKEAKSEDGRMSMFKIKMVCHWRNKNKVDKNKLFPGKCKFKNKQSL